MRGSLIVLEGAEGVGKTTQARRLVDALSRAGVIASHLREPGGTPLGEAIRKVLLEPHRNIAAAGEALLFMASRAQLVEEKVRPELDAGHAVVLDRFFLSTYAYQIHGRGLAPDDVRAANRMAVGDLVPNVTLVLQLATVEGLERAGRRSGHDYMETLGADFHSRVGAAFDEFVTPAWQVAHPECGRIVAIDANGSVDEVFERVSQVIADSAPTLRPALAQVAGAAT